MEKNKKSFFRDWFAEYKNVNWPSKAQVGSSIWVVLTFVCIISILLGLIDFGLVSFFNLIFGIR